MRGKILALDPDLIAFPLYVWNREPILALARELRHRLPGVRLVAGGPEATGDPQRVLAEGDLDAVIGGEGELAFAALVEAWAGKHSLSAVPGVTWRGPHGIVTGPEARPSSLNELPSPWLSKTLTPSAGGGVLWEISRAGGGGGACFDSRPGGSRHVAAERLEAELDLFRASGVAEVRILDPAFNFPPERGLKLLHLLRSAPHMRFLLEGRAEFLDPETAQFLARLPASVRLDLTTFDPEILQKINRTFDPESLARNLHLLRSEGARFQIAINYGLPGDTHRGFRSSLNTALELAPDRLEASPVAVYPGTVLHRNRTRFAMQTQDRPPYLLLASEGYPAVDLEASRRLAIAVEIFYNRGRAASFFPPLLKSLGQEPAAFLAGFFDWALGAGGIPKERLLSEEWCPSDILGLQEGYLQDLLGKRGRGALIPAAIDLIRFHFYQAETLEGEELPVVRPEAWQGRELWNTCWLRSPAARLATFTYEVLDLLEMDEIELEQFVTLFRPVGSVALFTRHGDQVLCESLEENTLRLLMGSDGRRSPRDIFSGTLSRQEGEEILEVAVTEGLLVPTEAPRPS